LLSLIYADGPQAYSNDVRIFGRRRGTGESIWEVKRLIGYISPEMQMYFGGGSSTVRDVVARGLNDTVGCYTRLSDEQTAAADQWIAALGMSHLADRTFSTLSTGQQRLALLARTLIKEAPLLLLDEPFHGLDASRKDAVRRIIDTIASRSGAAIVFVTHCPEEVPSGFDRALRLPAR
ncbi:MAG: ATP-binding cassette domain-containing protein, partial [Paramuribaculum sp.]|nr:ATP-binding cassette domain-containing protein [Paramuribaculum sp.]